MPHTNLPRAPGALDTVDLESDHNVRFRVAVTTFGHFDQAIGWAARAENELQLIFHRPDLRITHVEVDGVVVELHPVLPPEPPEFGGEA